MTNHRRNEMGKQRMIDIVCEMLHIANHEIPYYAYGDNEAACDMSNRLVKIADGLTIIMEELIEEEA